MVTDLRVTSVLSTEYTVGWTGVEGATAYQVDDGYGYAGTAWGYGPSFLYTVRDRKPGTTYFVQVRAYTNTENGVVFGPAASITVTTNPAGTCWVPSEQPVTVSTTWRTYQMAGECTFGAHRYQYTLSQDTVFIYGPAPSAGATTLWQYRYHVAGPLDGVAFEYAGLAWNYASDEPYQPICDHPDAKCVTTDDPPSDGGEGF